ncbi:hypothetical protein BASA84_001551 [Batrachochytrium salamandrivorans]|nr:hypothetical protein BASA84_001551 [Batrachochytrium salamandrivorans]
MKLSSFFVAAMVITSANAGLLDDIRQGAGNIRDRLVSFFSSSPDSNVMSYIVEQQMKDHPDLEHMFNDDEEHNYMLIDWLTIQIEFFNLLKQVELESLKYFDNTNIEKYLTQTTVNDDLTENDLDGVIMLEGIDYKAAMELIGYMYGCFSKFVEIESEYLKQHEHLPKALNTALVPARKLLTSSHVDRQTAVADHFVIRTSIRAEAQRQPPVSRAPIISRHHCLEVTDRIAWLRGGVLNGKADLDQRWLDGDCGA